MKPEASCQGKGIFLTTYIEEFSLSDRYVVQEYIANPLLIDGLKFDFRIYVLITGCNPLRIFLHKEGLARFATKPYVNPTATNLSKQKMHLTNYAINKNSKNFIFNEDPDNDHVGHKRSLTSTLAYLESKGCNTHSLWEKIKLIIIKTLCSVQPVISHTYRACQPDDIANDVCFEILGFDVLIDSKFKPWLLEVNHSPSFSVDSPLDKKIKSTVIKDTFELLNISNTQRKNYVTKKKADLMKLTMARKVENDHRQRELETAKAHCKRNKWESSHLGGFTQIYSPENATAFDRYLATASEIWEERTGARPKPKKEELKEPPKRVTDRPLLPRPKAKELPEVGRVSYLTVFDRLSKPIERKVSRLQPQSNFTVFKLEEDRNTTNSD